MSSCQAGLRSIFGASPNAAVSADVSVQSTEADIVDSEQGGLHIFELHLPMSVHIGGVVFLVCFLLAILAGCWCLARMFELRRGGEGGRWPVCCCWRSPSVPDVQEQIRHEIQIQMSQLRVNHEEEAELPKTRRIVV